MRELEQTALEIPVDIEHDGLRTVIFFVFIVLVVVFFIVLNLLIPAERINILAVFGALVAAAAVTYMIEQQLKARWKSGRMIRIADNRVILTDKSDNETTFTILDDIQLLRWQFKINRRTRVPKGWYMVAAALESSEDYICVYTLMSPDAYEQFDPKGEFTALQKPSSSSDSKSLRLAGEQRRLHKAESFRWHDGVEMNNEDFATYTQKLERLFPD